MFFGIVTQVDGCVFCCSPGCSHLPTPIPKFDPMGRRVFETKSGQFILVLEGKPGLNGQPVGQRTAAFGPDELPAVQVQNSSALGNGSLTVCDTGPPNEGGGGIPAVSPVSYDTDDPFIAGAIQDFGCRFQAFSPSAACTIVDPSRETRTIDPTASMQFCDIVAATAVFPPGDNVVTGRLADVDGATGPTKQIVVRVATPTPPL